MTRVAILTYDGCHASSLAGVADLLQVANAHLRRQQGPAAPVFAWHFVSMHGSVVTASNGLPLQVQPVRDDESYDVVFIPSLHYRGQADFDTFLSSQSATCAWLVRQWQRGAWLAANCTGTFILAQTGLLDQREATTTWWLAPLFRARFPHARLRLDPVITEDQRLLCAGPAASYLLLAIRLVERFAGPAIAAQCAKTMLLDVSQTTQTPYLPLIQDVDHTDSLVHRAQSWLSKNIAKPVHLSDLAHTLGTSERTLNRRFLGAINQTTKAYLQNLRLEAARSLLQGGDQNIDDIAARVGYSDISSFSRLFRKKIGMSPGQYRKRFQTPPEA